MGSRISANLINQAYLHVDAHEHVASGIAILDGNILRDWMIRLRCHCIVSVKKYTSYTVHILKQSKLLFLLKRSKSK